MIQVRSITALEVDTYIQKNDLTIFDLFSDEYILESVAEEYEPNEIYSDEEMIMVLETKGYIVKEFGE